MLPAVKPKIVPVRKVGEFEKIDISNIRAIHFGDTYFVPIGDFCNSSAPIIRNEPFLTNTCPSLLKFGFIHFFLSGYLQEQILRRFLFKPDFFNEDVSKGLQVSSQYGH